MNNMPITVIRAIELLGIMLLGALIVIGVDIIMPILMAFFISIMLLPLYRLLKNKKFPDTLAIIIPILLLFIFIALIVWFFSSQVGALISDFPAIKSNVNKHLTDLSVWIDNKTHYSSKQQLKFVSEQSNKFLGSAGNVLTDTLGSISGMFLFFGLIPIYIYLMLYYKNLFLKFIFMWFNDNSHKKVEESLRETETIIKSYLIGLLIQISYITILLGGILLLVGIKHALLIGVIFALLNLIPYVGALIGNIIGMMLTLTSSTEISSIVTVLVVIAIVQFLDNNILMPRILGSKVKINALSAILGVIIGGSLAGISGMFLSLPIIAVLKIVFDRSIMFNHWGYLLGDDVPKASPLNFKMLKRKKDLKIES